jgi:TldD protein
METISRRLFLKGACVTVASLSAPALLRTAGAQPPMSPAEEFPAPEAIDRILSQALSRGGDYADLYLESGASTRITLTDGRIQGMEFGILRGGGVRTVIGERVGYAYAESLEVAPLFEAATTSAAIASGGARGAAQPVSPINFPHYITIQDAIQSEAVARKVALLERVDRAARAVSPAVQQVVVGYDDSLRSVMIGNSAGQLARDILPLIYLRVTVTAEKDGRRAEGMHRISHRAGMEQLAGDAPEAAARIAAERAMRMLEAVPAPTGEMPVVIAAGGGVMFHEAVGHGLEADSVMRDASVFTGRSGQRVASDLVNLYDDGTMTGERGTINVDDEATLSQRTLLIERGVLRGYLQDRRTARNLSATPTGNGRRQSFRFPAIVRMSNTNLAPGPEAPEEIIRATPNGIYAAYFGGGEVDTVSGQFTFGLMEAYRIEEGRVTAPIRGANLVGSGIQVLERIDRVGSDFATWPGTCGKGDQWVPVSSGCPTLRISKITVGGTA